MHLTRYFKKKVEESLGTIFPPSQPPQPPTFVVPEEEEEVEANWGAVNQQQIEVPYNDNVSATFDKLKGALGDKIKNIKNCVYVYPMRDPGNHPAYLSFDEKDLFDPKSPVSLVIASGLTDIQMKIVLAHEYGHLALLEISRNAGSLETLKNVNYSLYFGLKSWNGIVPDYIDKAHRLYMGNNHMETEQLLRDAFPGETEEFYKYGKWGGGLIESRAFRKLPLTERLSIDNYLKKNKL